MTDRPGTSEEHAVAVFLSRWGGAIALVLVAAGFALRCAGISDYWLNPDEGIYYSTLTWPDSARFWDEVMQNAHPPLFYATLRVIASLTEDFLWLRMVACVFGSVAIFAVYLLGREAGGRGVAGTVCGLVAAALLAFAPGAVAMSQVMRPYMPLLAMVTLAAYFLLRCLDSPARGVLVGYVLTLSAALLLHYSAMLVLGAFGVALLGCLVRSTQRGRLVRRLAVMHAVPVVILLILYFVHLQPRLIGSAVQTEAIQGWLARFMIDSPAQAWELFLGSLGYLFGEDFACAGALAMIAGFALAIRDRRWCLVGMSGSLLVIAIAASAARHYPFGCSRHGAYSYGLTLLPIGYAFVGLAVGPVWSRLIGVGLLACALGFGETLAARLGAARACAGVSQEQLSKRADFERVAEAIRGDTSTVLLLGAQSYYVLLPLVRAARERAVNDRDNGLFYFDWEGRRVVVLWDEHGGTSDGWELEIGPDKVASRAHLFRLVEAADAGIPELALSKRNSVRLMFSGWRLHAPMQMFALDRLMPPGRKLVSELVGSSKTVTCRLRLADFLQIVRREIERRK